jgi:hypothetical protein
MEATIESLYVADESFYQTSTMRQVHGLKTVGFASTRPQSVFRYPPETYIHDECDESEPESQQHIAVTTNWSHGWLEGDGEDFISQDFAADGAVETKYKTKRGRKRNRKRVPVI